MSRPGIDHGLDWILKSIPVLILVWTKVISKTLGLGLEIQDLGCQDRVLVLVLTEFLNQDQSWYWSRLKFYFKTSLGLGLVWNLVSRQVLVLVSRGKKIKTKSIPNRIIMRNQKMDFLLGWLVVKIMIITFFVNSYMFFQNRSIAICATDIFVVSP